MSGSFGKLRGTVDLCYDRFVNLPFQHQHIILLEREVIGLCNTLLDIGCGDGEHLRGCTPHLQKSVGIDIFPPALKRASERGIYTQTMPINANEISKYFEKDSFDCVLAFDLIEHLDRPEGLTLLTAMEIIASKKVIVFTPNRFLPQSTLNGNVHQIHRSGWSVSEMRSRGYRVRGVHGIKVLLGEESRPRWSPNRLWKLISVLTQPLCLHIPELVFQIFCVKNIQK